MLNNRRSRRWIRIQENSSRRRRQAFRTDKMFRKLLDSFERPAVTASPVGTLRAGFSFGVVDAFFVRAADDAVGNYNRPNVLCFDECSDLFSDDRIQTYIGFLREPAFERIGITVFISEDANCNFRGGLYGRSIESDGRNRISAKSVLYLPVQPR